MAYLTVDDRGVWKNWLKYSHRQALDIVKKMMLCRMEDGIKYKRGFVKAAERAIYLQSQCGNEWAVVDAFARVEKEYRA